jgi:hypothetical protein
MINTTRVLTVEDIPEVIEIIQTRDHFAHDLKPIDHAFVDPYYRNEVPYHDYYNMTTNKEMFGLFEDGVLDNFVLLQYPTDLSCRADHPEEREKSVVLLIHWSRKKPNRKKDAQGFDVAVTDLLIEVHKYWESKGIFSNWVFINPDTHVFHGLKNKRFNDAIFHRYCRKVFSIPAGELRGDPEAQFINRWISSNHPMNVSMEAIVLSLKSEFRK